MSNGALTRSKKYRQSFNGFLRTKYSLLRKPPYTMKLTFEEFKSFCINNATLRTSFDRWKLSGFRREWHPVIRPVDAGKPITRENIEITYYSYVQKGYGKGRPKIPACVSKGSEVIHFESLAGVSLFLNIPYSKLYRLVKIGKYVKGWEVKVSKKKRDYTKFITSDLQVLALIFKCSLQSLKLLRVKANNHASVLLIDRAQKLVKSFLGEQSSEENTLLSEVDEGL